MNDRASAAPPADFLGPGVEGTADYEQQFAMDWKPPNLSNFGGGGGSGCGYSNIPGNRTSFMSVHSGVGSAFSTRPTTGMSSSASSKAPRRAGSGFFARVGEKFGLHRSRSSFSVGVDGDDHDDVNDDDDEMGDAGAHHGFVVPPVFKHTRSESMGANTVRGRGEQRHAAPPSFLRRDTDPVKLRKTAKTTDPVGAVPPVPAFDPTKRPSRDEIAANYQSLLASGFFGTHAIQSTRFSPPGRHQHRQDQTYMASFSQRLVEEDENSQHSRSIPPSPERQPPPPPPSRVAPPPPPPPPASLMDTDASMSTPSGIPISSTVVFNPVPLERTSSRGKDAPGSGNGNMAPPLSPAKRLTKPAHKPSLSFSSVPYTSTQPGNEPRPYRPPPIALSRFSLEMGRPRSLDLALQRQRGTKRPWAATRNDSQTSFMTDRTSYDYDPTDGTGIGLATTTTTEEEKHESGARKLVKRLRKSASKISIDLGRTMSRQNSTKFGGDNSNEGSEEFGELQPPSRTSLSSTVRRSFSWRLGSSKPGAGTGSKDSSSSPSSATDHHDHHQHSSSSGNNFFMGLNGSDTCFSLKPTNSSGDHAAPSAPVPPAHAAAPPALPVLTSTIVTTPSSAERNRLKKREIRGRRLRRKEGSVNASSSMSSPLKQPPMLLSPQQQPPPPPDSPTKPSTPTSRGSQSRSRSRPRRSDASILMMHAHAHAHAQSRSDDTTTGPGHAAEGLLHHTRPQFGTGEVSSSSNSSTSNAHNGMAHGGQSGADGMEGVEFSFHFPGRMKPGGPLTVVPDANRGVPNVPSIPGSFKKHGSVRVVRGDLF